MESELPLLGFGLPVSGGWATAPTIRRIARRAEELGHASLWTFQRVLYPVGSELGPSHEAGLDPKALRSSRGTPTGFGWGQPPSARPSPPRCCSRGP